MKLDLYSRINLFGCLIIAVCFSSCEKKKEAPLPPIPVSIVTVEPKTIPADFEYVGVGESSHIVEIRARIEGYLDKITYEEGSLVHEGNLLFKIDQRSFKAALDAAKGTLAREKAILWNAQETKNRMVPLYAKKAVSQKDLDDALAAELAAEANVMTAKANVEKASINLGYTSIRAPVTAMSNRAKFREGALISPGPHSLLTTLYVIDPIWVNFSVSEGDVLKAQDEVNKGLLQFPEGMNFTIEVILADGSKMPAEGRVDFADPSLQQSTGTMFVRATLPNQQGILRPSQFVRVILKGAKRPNAIIVPQTAVLQGQSGQFVFVVGKDGKVQVRPVETGPWYKNFWVIFEGLNKGDVVIVEGVNKVQNGSYVEIKKKLSDAPKKSSTQAYDIGS